jgi:hypothetical protein
VRRDVALRDSPLRIEISIPNQEEDPLMPEQKRVVETVKSGIIDSIRGTGEVVDAAINTVSGTLVNTIKGTGAVGAALTGTVPTSCAEQPWEPPTRGLTFAMRPRGASSG